MSIPQWVLDRASRVEKATGWLDVCPHCLLTGWLDAEADELSKGR